MQHILKTPILGPFWSRFWRQNRIFLRKRGVSKEGGKIERNFGPQGSAEDAGARRKFEYGDGGSLIEDRSRP